MNKELYQVIKKLRQANNFSQDYLAKQMGVSRPTYIQIEKGERDLTISEAEKIASIFSITFSDLFLEKIPEVKIKIEQNKKDQTKKKGLQIRITEKDMEKFKQVLLYVLSEVAGKPNVGETVLHKLLYFIDFDYYEKFEENLMGATYIKNHHGPTSVELAAIIKDMEKKGELEPVKSKYFTYEQKKYLPLKRANLEDLSAQEIEHIDDVLGRLSDKNAKELENYSHEDIPWKSAQDGKPLSYEAVLYRDEKYSVKNYEDEL